MELHELVSFLAMVEHRTLRKAAESLDITQPAVSLHLKNLEEDMMGPLFVRGGSREWGQRRRRPLSPLQLTPAGEELHLRASRIVREVEEAWTSVRELRGLPTGVVRLAIMPQFRDSVVAATAAMLQTRLKVRVALQEKNSPFDIEEDVQEGRVHLGLLRTFEVKYSHVAWERLGETPLRLIVNIQHPLAATETLGNIRELARERFVVPARGSLERASVDAFLQKQQLDPRIVIETSSPDFVLAYVRACPSLVTVLATSAHVDPRDLAFRDIPQPHQPMGTYLTWRGHAPRSAAARRVADAIRVQFRKGVSERESGSATPF